MSIQNRKSVLAIVKETTEGLPKKPTSGAEFVTLQTGFQISPNFETLESNELRASIAKAKPMLGVEQPTASLSHYLRHSGVEGQAPDYALLVETAFGSKTVNATQRLTASGSTVSTIKAASGGSDFKSGMAALIKDPVNGYKIRPIKSVATNDLALLFALPAGTAPGVGVGLGKCVNFSPVDEGHPTLSMWLYRGNGGLIELMAGARVSSYGMELQANQMLQQTFQLEGTSYYQNPLAVESTNCKLDFYDGTTDYHVTVPVKMYKDPHELAETIELLMNAVGSADVFTVEFKDKGASAGKFTITTGGATLSLKWSTGTNTANTIGALLGFNVAADDTGSTSYTSDSALTYVAPFTPSYDLADPLVAKANEIFLGDETESEGIKKVQSVSITVGNSMATIPDISEESGVGGKTVNTREVSIQIKGLIEKHDTDKFRRYRKGDKLPLCYNFGVKTGGNWIPGKCGNINAPNTVISALNVGDQDNLATLEITLTAYVANANGEGEFFLNYL